MFFVCESFNSMLTIVAANLERPIILVTNSSSKPFTLFGTTINSYTVQMMGYYRTSDQLNVLLTIVIKFN